MATETLPGFPGNVIDRSIVANRRSEAQKLLEDQLKDAQQALEAAYRVQLRARARALAADLRESLREIATEKSEASIAAISEIIQSSAETRGPIIARLGLLVGWPDDGRSDFVRFAAQKGPVEESWDAEAASLRKRLEEHDLWVAKRIDAVLAQFDAMLETEREANRQRILEETKKADAEAAELARKRFAQTAQLTIPKLLSDRLEATPGQGSTTVAVPGTLLSAKALPEPSAVSPPMAALRSRLELWLRIRGYKLASGPGSAPDRTGEFIAWTQHP